MATADHGASTAYLPADAERAAPAATFAPANWWPRVGATLLDQVLLLVAFVFIALLLTIGGWSGWATNATRLVLIVCGLAYATLMLTFNKGQTVGKEALRVRVVDEDGRPIGLGRAFGREAVKVIFGLTVIVWIVDVLWPLWQAENRALHDLIAGTRVLKAPKRPANGYYDAATGEPV